MILHEGIEPRRAWLVAFLSFPEEIPDNLTLQAQRYAN
jgi:hypothetical protein